MARTRLHAPQAQPVTFVELFFDLVFVFAVTQVTVLTAGNLDAGGVARSGVLFWLIWWAWTQFTWTLSPADTQHVAVRVLTLSATGAAFVMAASVPQAFASDPLWFAVPYVVIRLLGIGLQVRIDQEKAEDGPGISMRWVWVSTAGLFVVIGGALAPEHLRPWIWLAAIAVDLLAAGLAGGGDAEWDLDPRHFSERHGLFVIIALGESLIVAAGAIAEDDRSTEMVLAAGAALLVACLLWWTYFGWLKDRLEHGFAEAPASEVGLIARDAYSLLHFPLICGIIGFAVAIEEILLHPDRPADGPVIVALAVGISLFVGSSAIAFWRITRQVLTARLVTTAITVVVVFLLDGADPVWPLLAVAAGLGVVIALEERHHRNTADSPVLLD